MEDWHEALSICETEGCALNGVQIRFWKPDDPEAWGWTGCKCGICDNYCSVIDPIPGE